MAQNLLSNPELVKQIQEMQQTIQQTDALKSELNAQEELRERYRLQEEQLSQQMQVPEVSFGTFVVYVYICGHGETHSCFREQVVPIPVEMVLPTIPLIEPNAQVQVPMFSSHMVLNYPPPPINHAAIPPPSVPALSGPFVQEPVQEQPDIIVLEGDGKDVDLRRRAEEEKPKSPPPQSR